MGLFGNHKNDPAFGDRVRAAFAMLNGDQNAPFRFQQLQMERQRLMAAQDQRQEAQNIRNSQMDAAQRLGWSKDQLAATNADDLSKLVLERYTPRQYGPQGGSTGYTNPDGSTRYERAPWQQEVGRSIVGAGPNNANPGVIFRGVEPVSIPNVGVRGYTDQGLVDGPNPPPLGFLPQQQSAPPIASSESQIPPQVAAGPQPADARPQGQEAPAFNANPTDLANMPPVASFRDVQFGSPLANMPNLNRSTRNAPRRNGGTPAGQLPLVRTPAEAARLPRGTRFRTPDGQIRTRR